MRQQRVVQWRENTRFVAAEVVGRDQVQCGARFRLVVIMPMWTVPAAAVGDLLRPEAEQEKILLTGLRRHFDRRTVPGADRERSVHH